MHGQSAGLPLIASVPGREVPARPRSPRAPRHGIAPCNTSPRHAGELMSNEDTIPRIVCEPRALGGDLPGPPQWAVFLIGTENGDIEIDADGLTLAEAEEMT